MKETQMTPNQLIILLFIHTGIDYPNELWAENAAELNHDSGYLDLNGVVLNLTPKGESLVDAVIRTIKLPDTPFPLERIPNPADGLTKREYYRAHALTGILANPQYDRRNIRETVDYFAEAML